MSSETAAVLVTAYGLLATVTFAGLRDSGEFTMLESVILALLFPIAIFMRKG